jgi:large subunit ribosomal protein L19
MSAPSAIIQDIEKEFLRETPLPDFRPGDTIKVWVKIREGDKTRLQAFEGVCIKRSRGGPRGTFTVRKISYGVGVERIFPFSSPNVEKVEVKARGRVRQSRLYYLRGLTGKAARIRERTWDRAAAKKNKKARKIAAAEAAAASTPPEADLDVTEIPPTDDQG